MKISELKYLSDLNAIDRSNDNVDVHVVLEDGRVFSIVVATPGNLLWCMENERLDHYIGTPAIYVKSLTPANIERAIAAAATENEGRWLEMYGTLQL